MIKEIRKEGYVAFVKGDPKRALNNYWAGGSQTGTNKQTITTEIEKVSIANTIDELNMWINWFNHNHKNQIEFEIRPVLYIEKKELIAY